MASYLHLPERSGIYQIVNKTTEKRYVGYTSNIRQRLKGHVSDLTLGKHPNDYLQKAWDKYGPHDFTLLVLEECGKTMLCLREDYWVNILMTTDRYRGYNINPTDPNGKAGRSEETIEKIRVANKGRRPSALCIERRKQVKTSEEGRLKQREGLSKVDWYKLREDKRKKVIDTITGNIFDSLTIAAQTFGIPKHRLSKYLVGTRTNKTNLKYL